MRQINFPDETMPACSSNNSLVHRARQRLSAGVNTSERATQKYRQAPAFSSKGISPHPSCDEQQLARRLAALHVGMGPGRIRQWIFATNPDSELAFADPVKQLR
jgi:hypothetical protein